MATIGLAMSSKRNGRTRRLFQLFVTSKILDGSFSNPLPSAIRQVVEVVARCPISIGA
jgi:hypothetical protein